jgi:hypothetical protein
LQIPELHDRVLSNKHRLESTTKKTHTPLIAIYSLGDSRCQQGIPIFFENLLFCPARQAAVFKMGEMGNAAAELDRRTALGIWSMTEVAGDDLTQMIVEIVGLSLKAASWRGFANAFGGASLNSLYPLSQPLHLLLLGRSLPSVYRVGERITDRSKPAKALRKSGSGNRKDKQEHKNQGAPPHRTSEKSSQTRVLRV